MSAINQIKTAYMSANAVIRQYSVHSRAFFKRAKAQLATRTVDGLLYAALELRLAIERRQSQYAAPWGQISQSTKNEWHANKIARELERAFQSNDRITHVRYASGQQKMFTPVSDRLMKIYALLGNYLHGKCWGDAADLNPADKVMFFHKLHDLLVEGLAHLAVAVEGTLLGPLLENPAHLDPTTNAPYFTLITDKVDADGFPLPPGQNQATATAPREINFVLQQVPLAPVLDNSHRDFKIKFPRPDYT